MHFSNEWRLVFFLEEAPIELKSVVDFLNKQMERTEVLLVEARQYLKDDLKLVVPTLFGYTEEARLVKRTVSVIIRETKKWDRTSFFEEIGERLETVHGDAIVSLFNKCKALGCDFLWGNGKLNGSFSTKWSHISKKTILTVYTNGTLCLNFGKCPVLKRISSLTIYGGYFSKYPCWMCNPAIQNTNARCSSAPAPLST